MGQQIKCFANPLGPHIGHHHWQNWPLVYWSSSAINSRFLPSGSFLLGMKERTLGSVWLVEDRSG
jgi:hypothetical protein